MKIIAKYLGHLFDNKHRAELRLRVDNVRHTQLLNELDDTKEYYVELREVKSKRSIQQNRYMWALLKALEEKSETDMIVWYCMALEECEARYDYVLGTKDIFTNLVSSFRAVQRVGKRIVNDKELTIYKCFYGSSKMNTKEMTKLIDKIIEYCNEYYIDTEIYKIEL